MYYPNTGLFHALVINSVLLDIPELFWIRTFANIWSDLQFKYQVLSTNTDSFFYYYTLIVLATQALNVKISLL